MEENERFSLGHGDPIAKHQQHIEKLRDLDVSESESETASTFLF